MLSSLCLFAFTLCFSLHAPDFAEARPTFVQRIPNSGSVPGVRALGHQNPNGGGAINAFGEAFEAAGTQWTQQLCHADSDGDGATNGEELGDPCCTWQPGGAVSRTTSITHPGVANSFSPTELSAMRCATASAPPAAASTTNSPTAPTQPATEPPTTAEPDVAVEAPVSVSEIKPSTVPSTSSAPMEKTPMPLPPIEDDAGRTTTPTSGASASKRHLMSLSVVVVILLAVSTGVLYM